MLSTEDKCLAKETSDQHGRKMLGRVEKGSAELKNAWHSKKNTRHSREMLVRTRKCPAEKKRSSAEQQCAYKRSIVLVGHSKSYPHIVYSDAQSGDICSFIHNKWQLEADRRSQVCAWRD